MHASSKIDDSTSIVYAPMADEVTMSTSVRNRNGNNNGINGVNGINTPVSGDAVLSSPSALPSNAMYLPEGSSGAEDANAFTNPSATAKDDSVRVDARLGCCANARIGNTIVLYRANKSAMRFPKLCMVGPDYPCMSVTYLLVTAPSIAFLVFVAPFLHVAVMIVGIVLLAVTLFALSLTACSNPGYLPRQSLQELNDQRNSRAEGGVLVLNTTACRTLHATRVTR